MLPDELIESGSARLRTARHRLSRTGDERVQAEELLEAALGRRPRKRESIPPRVVRKFESFIDRRMGGEPMPYITGFVEFMGLRLEAQAGAFAPRWSTEFLVGQAVARLRRRTEPVAVDVACGVGTIGLAIASKVPHADVRGVDIEPHAIKLARRNARANGIQNARFHVGDLFSPLPASLRGRIDVIAGHPPYVARAEVADLPAELREFEPTVALTDGSPDGLGLTRAIVRSAGDWLRPQGWLMLETGTGTSRATRSEMIRCGFADVRSLRPPHGLSRVVLGRNG